MRLGNGIGIGFALALLTSAAIAADGPYSPLPRQRLAEATADACLADCASRAASCKQVCPGTFGVPCQSACDSQYKSCRDACRPR